MHVVFFQVQPVAAGDLMADGIGGVGVQGHFGVAGSPGSKVDNAVVVASRPGRGELPGGFTQRIRVEQPAVARVLDDDFALDLGTFGGDFIEPGRDGVVGDDAGGPGFVAAEFDVLGGELGGARCDHQAHADAGGEGLPPLDIARQDDDNDVPALQTLAGQHIGQAFGVFADLGEGSFNLGSVVVNPEHRQLVGVTRPFVDDIAGEVEVLRHLPFKGRILFVVICHIVCICHACSFPGRTAKSSGHAPRRCRPVKCSTRYPPVTRLCPAKIPPYLISHHKKTRRFLTIGVVLILMWSEELTESWGFWVWGVGEKLTDRFAG